MSCKDISADWAAQRVKMPCQIRAAIPTTDQNWPAVYRPAGQITISNGYSAENEFGKALTTSFQAFIYCPKTSDNAHEA